MHDLLDVFHNTESACPGVPFYTFLCKIASRCNLDCDYCYMYHLADQSWKKQPKRMSPLGIRQTAKRIREHVEAHSLPEIDITMHGGEPLLIGEQGLRAFIETMQEHISPVCNVMFGVQTNATLLTRDIIDLFVEKGVTVGVSLDGTEHDNDRHRLTISGKSSYNSVLQGVNLLRTRGTPEMFGGFLSVIDLEADPLEAYHHLSSFQPPSVDFVLPDGNFGSYPPGKGSRLGQAPYADWLIPIFDEWYQSKESTPVIRHFQEIVNLILGVPNSLESLGLGPVDLVVIETNGEIEAVDTLKSSYEGATSLGLNVFNNSFDEALQHVKVLSRQVGLHGLSSACKECEIVRVCGGGYLPHRYDPQTGFNNPSVYCADLWKLIWHIRSRLLRDLQRNSRGISEKSWSHCPGSSYLSHMLPSLPGSG